MSTYTPHPDLVNLDPQTLGQMVEDPTLTESLREHVVEYIEHLPLIPRVAAWLTRWWESPEAYKASFIDSMVKARQLCGIRDEQVVSPEDWDAMVERAYNDWVDGYIDGVERVVQMLVGWALLNDLVSWKEVSGPRP